MRKRPCWKLFFAAVYVLAAATAGDCASCHVEFRPVLSQDELQGKKFDKIECGPGVLYVWGWHYLSERDLEKVEAFRSGTRRGVLMAGFTFNKEGRKRLYKFTKKFAKRQVAIFVEGAFAAVPVVWAPYFMGDRVVVDWPGTKKELLALAGKINRRDTVISLYIEEQGRYNDIAADAWASAYENCHRYMERKRAQFNAARSSVEEVRDF